jgi:hypothetical protein
VVRHENSAAAGSGPFDGLIIDDDGRELSAVQSLDFLIMEYAKVRGGYESESVVVPAEFRDKKAA